MWISTLLTFASAYAILGLVFAVFFAWRGAQRLDPAAQEGTLGFRCLLLPAAAALWPWLGWRVVRAGRQGS